MDKKVVIKEIEELIAIMKKEGLTRIAIKQKDFEIELEKAKLTEFASVVSAPAILPAKQESQPVKVSEEKKEEGKYIVSPIVGTFYRAASPKDAPFLKEGDSVDIDNVVCIIEAMKVMNEVKSSLKGKVAEILVKNGDPVEFGTKLFKIV